MKSREDNKKMSKDCKYFVQHAWKKDLCANCFESREDHLKKFAKTKPYVVKDVKNIQVNYIIYCMWKFKYIFYFTGKVNACINNITMNIDNIIVNVKEKK